MKISTKLIEELVKEVAGEDVLPLIHAIKNKKNVSEFKLAEKIGEEVNITRNMLYRLHDANLVSFIRRKDKVKGWYIYYWTFKSKGIKYHILRLKQQKLSQFKERIIREETEQFYLCPSNCMRLNFDQAFDFNFKCPECGTIMELQDNTEKIEKLKEEIKEIELELKENAIKKKSPKKISDDSSSKKTKVENKKQPAKKADKMTAKSETKIETAGKKTKKEPSPGKKDKQKTKKSSKSIIDKEIPSAKRSILKNLVRKIKNKKN